VPVIPRRRVRMVLAVSAVLLPLALAACGGDDDAVAVSSAPPSTAATTAPETTVPATTTTEPSPTTTGVPTEYIVQKGDNLSKIAKRFGTTVTDLVTLNAIKNPDRIPEGLRLKLPPPTTSTAPAPSTVAPTTTVAP
jgi:LysM repeat protein